MTHPPLLPAPLYRGGANAWECDEGGHLNVRFHAERCHIGLTHFAHALGMAHPFRSDAAATLSLIDLHARFLKEARPGDGLSMHGAVIALGEDAATLCFDMRHADGAPATTFTLRTAHVEPHTLKRFAWSARSRAAAKTLKHALPAHARPRSIDADAPLHEVSLARARELGALRIGAAAITTDQCDAFGRLRFEHLFGRVSDSVSHLFGPWRRALAAETGAETAGAMLEARLALRRLPSAGDLVEIHSGLVEVGEKTLRVAHWLIDPVSGDAWASLEAMTLTFDPRTRKALAYPPRLRAEMHQHLVAMGA